MRNLLLTLTLSAAALLGSSPAYAVQLQGDFVPRAQAIVTHMPGPAGPPILANWGQCPFYDNKYIDGCADAGANQLWINPQALNPSFVFEHELGHFTDARNLSDDERATLEAKMGFAGNWSDCGDASTDVAHYGFCAKETYADTYANCALGLAPLHYVRRGKHRATIDTWNMSYGFRPNYEQARDLCRMIRGFLTN